MNLSFVIPARNEAAGIRNCLQPLQKLRKRGHEVIVADGYSDDATCRLAAPLTDRIVTGKPCRATQMNAGAAAARGDLLVFLHADTRLPEDAAAALAAVTPDDWGRFDVRLDGGHPCFRGIEKAMNLRSRLTGIATGDQGIFVGNRLFSAAGGFPPIPLMEDIALSRRLGKYRRPLCLRQTVLTSSRRWERDGILNTVLLMWALRLGYAAGVNPARLARFYR
ncbi:MAG: TIGR04283 family arsenosugar biosynthesis glycosyltransferase [Gammaproteobacteria bacterium]|nr:TIGR04283 family arsenosugar biosynthesis glycosyltransferase [Gammaproteobacteria bacterium]MDD9824216.1 TIGR04283 family arsenosugar biosynthesis glycosyltransferase [Gammaproteobacteria bacterium]